MDISLAFISALTINTLLIIGVCILFGIVLVVLVSKSMNQGDSLTIDTEFISSLINIFGKDNVINISSEISRLKVEVKDIDKVDFEKLKVVSEGVFISGSNIKVMFKDNAEKIVQLIKERL